MQKILKEENALETLYYGLAIAAVMLAMTTFIYVSIKEKEVENDVSDDDNETRAEDLKTKQKTNLRR